MGKQYDAVDGRLAEFVAAQPVFFVATAPTATDGHVNVSPKGVRGSFAVVDPRTVAYLDYTGSGVETIAHLRENGRIVVMFCAFEGPPRVVRLHGRGSVALRGAASFDRLAPHFPGTADPGVRAIVEVAVTRISDSCGYGVPLLAYQGERTLLDQWAQRKGVDGVAAYHATRNAVSIDGLPGMPAS